MNGIDREKHDDGGASQGGFDFGADAESAAWKVEYQASFEAYPQVLPRWMELLRNEPIGGYPKGLREALGLPEDFVGAQIEGWDLLRLIAKKEMVVDPLPKSFYEFDKSVDYLRADMKKVLNRSGEVVAEDELDRRVREELERLSPGQLKELGSCKVDLHMGRRYQHFARTNVASVRIGQPLPQGILIEGELGENDTLILQVGELINATTVERLLVPDYIRGSMDGKSGNARIGLGVETASLFDAGFDGDGVMELTNSGPIPIEIGLGDRICAMDFFLLSSPAKHPYRGKYYQQQRPQGGKNE